MPKVKTNKIQPESKVDPFAWAKETPIQHSEDVVRIRQVLENLGFTVTLHECHALWSAYSKTQEGKPEWMELPLTFGALRSKLVNNVLPEITGVIAK